MEQEQGRARGRARGRGRARVAKEDVPRGPVAPRPGSAPETKKQPAAYPPPATSQATGEPVVAVPGRGVKRGALQAGASGMGESRMAALSLTDTYSIGRKSNYDASLFEPTTIPKHFAANKKDASGRPLMLQTNYFPLACARDWCLYQYRVDYDPEVDHRGARKGMLKDHKDILGNYYVFDGTMCFTTKRLKDKVTEVFSTRRSDDSKIRIKLTMTNELQPNDPVSIQIYNIIFRWILEKIGMEQIGRHYYNPSMGFTVACNRVTFELWPGFITSILQYEKNTMLCAEISHKLMRKDTVLNIMMSMYREAQQRGRNFQEEVTKFLLGQIVLTRYNNNTYRIDDIRWDLKVNDTFPKRGEKISYIDYYKQAYNVDITDKKQPMLVSRPKKREIRKGGLEEIHLVPELCTVTGLTDDLRADFQTMKKLAEHTKQGPVKRVAALKRFISTINSQPEVKDRLKNWGLKFEDNLATVQGRVLPDEQILFEGGRSAQAGPQANWDREFRNQKLFKCVDCKEWLFIHTKRDASTANDLMNNLNKTGRPMGFNLARPSTFALESDRISDIQNTLKTYVQQHKGAQIIVCMLPSNRKDRYDAIKKICCVDLGIPSQVVLSKTVSNPKRAMSVATKIAIQMNCKLGGEAWAVKIPLKQTMLVGIDTYHDSSQKGRSVGGFCATMNQNYTKWYSNVTFQTTGTELSDGIKRCLTGALARYEQVNGTLPERIIVFRDGVGDGQLEMVKGYEIKQMWDCMKAAGFKKKPAFSFIVVKKRVNARFFAQGGREGLSNPPPGTIVDDVVTKKEWFDFYIVPQSVREGTVTPTHFNVIEDEPSGYMQLKPGHFQKLAYKLCHLYYNWPGTIRVPAPCMYAHKLAFLVGQSVHQQVAENLSDRLYFL